MRPDLLAALERLAKAGGYEQPRLILASQPVQPRRGPWWLDLGSASEYGAQNPVSGRAGQ